MFWQKRSLLLKPTREKMYRKFKILVSIQNRSNQPNFLFVVQYNPFFLIHTCKSHMIFLTFVRCEILINLGGALPPFDGFFSQLWSLFSTYEHCQQVNITKFLFLLFLFSSSLPYMSLFFSLYVSFLYPLDVFGK